MKLADNKATLSFSNGSPQVELPVYQGTIGPDVIDIRKLYAQTGMFTYDPGFMSTASCQSTITYIDGDKGELLYRGYPIEQLATKCDFLETCHLLLYGELPNADAEDRLRLARDQPHHGQRADAVLPARLPPRRAPDGRDDRPGGRAVGLLSRQHGHQQPGAPRDRGHPPDRQDADAGVHGLQVRHRPALHLPEELAVVHRELHAHDVRHAVRGLHAQRRAGARHGPHLHPARRPRAERVDVDGAPVRQLGHQPVRRHRGRRGLPVGPGARRRQRGGAEHAGRHPEDGRRGQDRRVRLARSRTRTPASS
jgi:hypothetical protein